MHLTGPLWTSPAMTWIVVSLFGRSWGDEWTGSRQRPAGIDPLSADPVRFDHVAASQGSANGSETPLTSELTFVDPSVDPTSEPARCFLRLANLPNYALDGLNQYEATLLRHKMARS